MSEMLRIEDSETYPAEQSALGNNAYFLRGCQHHAPSVAYASCLNRIENRKKGRLPEIYAACSVAINCGDCMALGMQEQEQLAGKALYYINRDKLIEKSSQDELTAMERFAIPIRQRVKMPARSAKSAVAPVAAPAEKEVVKIDTGGYADALNAALAEKPKAGMSLAEIAKLRRKEMGA